MPSGIETILERKQPPLLPSPIPQGTLKTSDSFWKEYFRVQSDKIFMLVLIALLHWWHADDKLQAAAVGGLIILIQGQRFKLG